VTRADLPPGAQACQAVHAACDFALAHPALFADWHRASNTIVCLVASDELALQNLYGDAVAARHRLVRVHEPDFGGALTALALEAAAHRLVRRLPLALARDGPTRPSTWDTSPDRMRGGEP
jgi:hypothetical protein